MEQTNIRNTTEIWYMESWRVITAVLILFALLAVYVSSVPEEVIRHAWPFDGDVDTLTKYSRIEGDSCTCNLSLQDTSTGNGPVQVYFPKKGGEAMGP